MGWCRLVSGRILYKYDVAGRLDTLSDNQRRNAKKTSTVMATQPRRRVFFILAALLTSSCALAGSPPSGPPRRCPGPDAMIIGLETPLRIGSEARARIHVCPALLSAPEWIWVSDDTTIISIISQSDSLVTVRAKTAGETWIRVRDTRSGIGNGKPVMVRPRNP